MSNHAHTFDAVTKIGNTVIQHGKYNDRVYLMKLAKDDVPAIIGKLDRLAQERSYGKIFAKAPASARNWFLRHGYLTEALVPKFFDNREDACFMGKFLSPERMDGDAGQIRKVLKAARLKASRQTEPVVPSGFEFRIPRDSDLQEMSRVYRKVFDTYPFPIHDPEYLAASKEGGVIYFSIFKDGKIAALSSAEIDPVSLSAEMSDFATLPEHRGQGLALCLLRRMEKEVKTKNIRTAYSIARSVSMGMNLTFAASGYRYGGTLINNTNISGNLESMNVWYKHLA